MAAVLFAFRYMNLIQGKGMFITKFHGLKKIPLKLGVTREKQRVDPLNKKMYMLYKLNAVRK
ncbi:hypothetical protein [Clostridium oryzae]|uniref:hypothetical protein n=1 Tax=Clostridium oryzae TaxID=1450648 RepID=UPI0009A4B41B|nr:hypothetical protein [Clostridium oryzae]